MTKKEILWRFLVIQAITYKKLQFQQKELAEKFGISLSTVNNALKAPRELGIIKVTGRYFLIQDSEKFLYLWATNRKLSGDIIYSTHVEGNVREIEAKMPGDVIFTAYSGYEKFFGEPPADYDKVYVYSNFSILPELKKRFPERKGYNNLFILKSDLHLEEKSPKKIVPVEQLFVDIWNLTDWYAKDFLKALKEKLFL